MTAVIQRVLSASVEVDGVVVSDIKNGFLVLLGISDSDTRTHAEILAQKTAKLRIFEDENGKMNRSLLDFRANADPYEALVVPNFTLCANCKGGNRPEFLRAARPESARALCEHFTGHLRSRFVLSVKSGVFGADMKVALVNDGPVTIVLDTDTLISERIPHK